jgi:tol-pal system protein YbgF
VVRDRRLGILCLVLAAASASGGCYTKRMQRIEYGLDTLRVQVDSVSYGNTTAWRQMRRDLAEQRELLVSLKAGTNVSSKELIDRIEELSSKLDDTVDRMMRAGLGSARTGAMPDTSHGIPSSQSSGVDAESQYEQAAKDFTQGRFELALAGFRQLLSEYPNHELSDNALYGVGESYYALAKYDSAAVAYRQVEDRYPRGDRVPAALYKLGMVYQKQGDREEAKKTFTRLKDKFPRSGEARLADERLRELGR